MRARPRRFRIGLNAVVAGAAICLGLVVFSVVGPCQVYFVPLEAAPELLQSLRSYYQNELGLNVIVLPSIQLTSTTWSPQRRQLIAERVTQLIYQRYWSLRWPSRSIVVGVTGRDMYIEGRPWQFAFSWREAGRISVVSYARMDPQAFREPADQALLESRLRKMVTRNIGMLAYGLPLTADRDSLMYQDVLGLEELDQLKEDLRAAGFPDVVKRHLN